MTLPLVVFAAVLALVIGPYLFFVSRPEDQDARRLKRRLKGHSQTRQRAALVKVPERLSSVGAVERLLGYATSAVDPVKRLIEQSGLRLSVGRFVLATGCAFIIPFLIVNLATGRTVFGLIAGACCGALPTAWVRRARTKRLWKFEEQFPEAIDLIARALRAGHTFPTGLSMGRACETVD